MRWLLSAKKKLPFNLRWNPSKHADGLIWNYAAPYVSQS